MPAAPGDVWQSFETTAARVPGGTAIAWRGREVTFRELEQSAAAHARDFAELGLAAGDVVAVSSADPAAFVALVLAAMRSSAAALLLSPGHGAQATRSVLGVAAWLVSESNGHVELARGTGGPSPFGDTAIVKLSSGSTSEPKAIAVSASAVLAEADAVCVTLGLEPGTRILCPVPLHHSYGFDLAVLPMLRVGATIEVHAPLVPSRLVRELPGARVFLGVPAIYGTLLETPLEHVPELSGDRYLLSCTAPLAVTTIEAFHDRFGGLVCQHYGSSEVGAVTTHVPSEVLARPASVGRAMPGVRIEIVDGEVTVAGPALASGYLLGAPDRSPFRDGRFFMGDNGALDADGFLTVTGRRDALINVGGLKVSPEEVQLVLERHPAVREALVGGRADGHGGEFVRATVAVRGDVTELELIAYCRAELEDFKVPRRIELADELPRLPSGKLDRRG